MFLDGAIHKGYSTALRPISCYFFTTSSNKIAFPRYLSPMDNLIFCVVVQLNLIFGVAGLIWPDKLKPLFGVLMFPWPVSYRAIRTHGIVAVIGYVLVLGKLLVIAQ
jgi:hypothetical protein